MSLLLVILAQLISLYVYVLLARVVIDLIQVFSRDWRPKGFLLVICEFIFTVTDPPLRFLRRFIPPLRLGGISLDLAFLVLIIGIQIVSGFLLAGARALA